MFCGSGYPRIDGYLRGGRKPDSWNQRETILQQVAQQTGKKAVYIKNEADIASYLQSIVKAGDLVITMGAGTIYRSGERLVELLEKAES